MKSRVRRIANFIAFNLLFFALYLNFIHRDKASAIEQLPQSKTAGFAGTVLTETPSSHTEKNSMVEANNAKNGEVAKRSAN